MVKMSPWMLLLSPPSLLLLLIDVVVMLASLSDKLLHTRILLMLTRAGEQDLLIAAYLYIYKFQDSYPFELAYSANTASYQE